MKTKTIVLFVLCLLILISTGMNLKAQQIMEPYDSRLARDLGIMEGVLEKLLDEPDLNLSIQVSSLYLPGEGIIFEVNRRSGLQLGNIYVRSGSGRITVNQRREQADNDSQESDAEARRAIARERIMDFFQNYATAIRLPGDNEKIYIVYKESADDPVFHPNERSNVSGGFIMYTARGDIEAFRQQQLNAEEFSKRVCYTDDTETGRDLAIMAGIFESALASAEEQVMRVSGNVNHSYIPGLGAMFTLQIRPARGVHIFAERPDAPPPPSGPNDAKVDSILRDLEIEIEMEQVRRRARVISEQAEELRKNLMLQFGGGKELTGEEMEAAYQQLEKDLAVVLVDYGRTLASVESGESVILNISFNRNFRDMPSRLIMSITKSDIENLSRNEALDSIRISRTTR